MINALILLMLRIENTSKAVQFPTVILKASVDIDKVTMLSYISEYNLIYRIELF